MIPSFVFKILFFFSAISKSSDIGSPQMVSVFKISETDQIDDVCILKYALAEKFKNLPTPPWVEKWDNLMFHSFCDNKYDVKVAETSPQDDVAKSLLFSLASGFSIPSWDETVSQNRLRRHSLQDLKEDFWKTGNLPRDLFDESVQEEKKDPAYKSLKKRSVVELNDPIWECDTQFPAKVSLLRDLQRDLESKGDVTMDLSKPAICKSFDQHFACLSWGGNARRIRAKVAAQTIMSGISAHTENSVLSCWAKEALKEVSLNTICLSNIPYNC